MQAGRPAPTRFRLNFQHWRGIFRFTSLVAGEWRKSRTYLPTIPSDSTLGNLAHPPRLSIPSICSVLFLYVCSRYCNFLSRFASSFLQSSASLSCFFCTSGILVPTNLFLLSAHHTPLHSFFLDRTMFHLSPHTSFRLHRRPGSGMEDLTALCWTVGVCAPRASCSRSGHVRC